MSFSSEIKNYPLLTMLTRYSTFRVRQIKQSAPNRTSMASVKFVPELIAPCGMNCALCKAYNAYSHGIPAQKGKVTLCAGCLPRAKNCYIKRGCQKLTKHQIQTCHECTVMPCKHLDHLDSRYRERYGVSMVENLKMLKTEGMNEFLKNQQEKHRCSKCGGVICVHDGKCYSCGQISKKIGV